MATLVGHLNAQPVSTRFRIRLATVWVMQVMREPIGINLPAGARRASTVKLAHPDSFRQFEGQVTAPDGAAALSDVGALVRALPLGIGS
jgi:hypothetical protein